MKIITSEAVYVQKNDIVFLNHTDLLIPVSIFLKVFGNGITIIDDSNRFEFIRFEEQSDIEYFKNLDWIIDYSEVKNLTDDEIIRLGNDVAQERNNIAKTFNSMTEGQKKEHMHMVDECEMLDFKMYSLRDIILFRQGKIKMTLPTEIDTIDDKKKERVGKRRILGIFSRKGRK